MGKLSSTAWKPSSTQESRAEVGEALPPLEARADGASCVTSIIYTQGQTTLGNGESLTAMSG